MPLSASSSSSVAGTQDASPAAESTTTAIPTGLSTAEAQQRRVRFGPNVVGETLPSFRRLLLTKLWAPVPWLLEGAIALQILLGAYIEAAIIGLLLAFNIALSLAQEQRASAALSILRKRLEPTARVCRDGKWHRIPAAELVPDDAIELPIGSVSPADVRVTSGSVAADQSMLTGESALVDISVGATIYAGAIVKRGHAFGVVAATGTRTYFGRTVELVRIARAPSAEQHTVLATVRNLGAINGVVALAALGYALHLGFATAELLRLALTMLLASVPVALPATFTLSAALSALTLSRRGALLTSLSAVHEAAAMDVLCSDKTGTLTQNTAEIAEIVPMPGFTTEQILHLAALTCEPTGDEPLDAAILRAAALRDNIGVEDHMTRREPFDPDTKMSQACFHASDGGQMRVAKGALQAIERIANVAPDVRRKADDLASRGNRIIAVAVEAAATQAVLAGLIALSDPPREDAASLIASLRDLGVRTVMVTGDSAATATAIARDVGLRPEPGPHDDGFNGAALSGFDVFARVMPEDKYHLVQAFQVSGHVVGMCGDGVNDAPALRQAQVGIAVASASDAAKAAAAIVLTEPGLSGVVAAIIEGRKAFRRLLTYTLNMLVKKIEVVLLMAYGLIALHQPVITPMIMIILLVTNDFLTMSLTTDHVEPRREPQNWNMKQIVFTAAFFGGCKLVFSAGVVAVGAFGGQLPPHAVQTLAFLAIAFGNQSMIYVLRAQNHLWDSKPSRWLVFSSVVDTAIVCGLVLSGVLVTALPLPWVLGVGIAAAGFALFLDQVRSLARRVPGLGHRIAR
ncbi:MULTISPECIES: HAD-IC family P-type ATPase [Burkholderia cepacia complex]|uniref:HAD-IC family P-type ATPase n=1 Tax=Burkholderia cenocepacia TaxID=95486 RepID=A0ABD4U4R9_9BURK|nr:MULTISPECIES: HAD-IC family P-type ATPase [Burkholderia cepacia complex]MCW3694342.1 HAD-IC family P-type ATPase [Burkholderia cenocepacia]MCW3702431.1 HAD-IC family P-type ATPase [Burkholderia cenocepacia]MCW3709702.1 HAD-IC family P-type ATPase [Burkholderia cenocepacia]MCW3718297.1 HAD-IC family P-type ATPase [Burkholderia cenocepacia]MCW3726570.1 HAD-IC family P-type ATPase [Burkholderia cenocepacia]